MDEDGFGFPWEEIEGDDDCVSDADIGVFELLLAKDGWGR